jgi:hypothetical protein
MPDTTVRIPAWADPNNASVLDNWWTRTARTLGGFLGAADPTSQAMAIGAPVELPAPEGNSAGMTLKAYHGSPHDFDQFSLGKIGTGEGGQAYGHGLYFAENPEVARSYRNSNAPAYQNTHIANIAYEAQRAAESATGLKGTAAKPEAMKWLQSEAEKASPYQRQSFYDAMNNYDAVMSPPSGRTYEVNLHASPDELLDWDKPLSQQSPKVQQVVRDTLSPKAMEKMRYRAGVTSFDQLKGADLYEQLVSRAGGSSGHTEGTVSQQLKDAGIKGIQYLDQGSRAAGEGTKNFVIFDDKIIEIAKKYGISLPVAASLYKWQQSQQGK